MLAFAEVDKKLDLVDGTTKKVFMGRKRKSFIEGEDFVKITLREYNEKYGRITKGNPNIPVICLTEKGCDKVKEIKFGVKSENIVFREENPQPNIFRMDQEPTIIQILEMQTRMIEADIRRNEEFRKTILAMLNGRMAVSSKEEDESAQEKTAIIVNSQEEPFSRWKSRVCAILPGNKEKRNELLCDTYQYMSKVYGICWDQQKKDFRKENGRYPNSTLEIAYWLNGKKQYKNLFENVLHDMHS